MISSKIIFTGAFVPENIVTNDMLSEIVDTNDEWIASRTGIKQRHISKGENTSDIATKTAENIIKEGNLNPKDIDLIIVATVSADYNTPSTACLVQANIGAENAFVFDISAACSGFIYGLSIADKFIKSGTCKNAIVIGAEILSKMVDWNDRSTCVLFGDGAAGAYVERAESGGILCEDVGSDGLRAMMLTASHKISSNIFTENKKEMPSSIYMDGHGIFQFATREVPKSINKLIEKSNVNIDDIKYFIPHQANSRIVEIIARKVKIPIEKFYMNMAYYGNTSSASIPLALNEMNKKNMLQRGDKIIITGFGGGLTWGSLLIEW